MQFRYSIKKLQKRISKLKNTWENISALKNRETKIQDANFMILSWTLQRRSQAALNTSLKTIKLLDK